MCNRLGTKIHQQGNILSMIILLKTFNALGPACNEYKEAKETTRCEWVPIVMEHALNTVKYL